MKMVRTECCCCCVLPVSGVIIWRAWQTVVHSGVYFCVQMSLKPHKFSLHWINKSDLQHCISRNHDCATHSAQLRVFHNSVNKDKQTFTLLLNDKTFITLVRIMWRALFIFLFMLFLLRQHLPDELLHKPNPTGRRGKKPVLNSCQFSMPVCLSNTCPQTGFFSVAPKVS